MAYRNTLQADTLRLVAKKLQSPLPSRANSLSTASPRTATT